VTIAFATYESMRPKRSTACSTTRATSSWTAQSAVTARASDPAASISRTHASSASLVRAVTTTRAPRAPAARATARPSPLEAPVTTITWSASGVFTPLKSPSPPASKRATLPAMTGLTQPWHIALILLIALLLFGGKRLPEIGRSLGTGMREFKDSITGHNPPDEQQQLPPAETAAPAPQPTERETV
jgi:sec-independent protein translocase protein TatA